jgi:hypothetical protein
MTQPTGAHVIAEMLAGYGVRRVLAHSEKAAAYMAG